MNFRILTVGLLAFGLTAAHAQIRGAGSSFAASLYDGWAATSGKAIQVKLDYASTGSSSGVKAAIEHSSDFGASDRPLSRAELDSAGLVQFPTAIGGVVLMTNLPGIAGDKLHLDGATLAGIYLGKIKQWSDPAIKALNPELALPATPIVPAFRGDGSGTSFVFTTYLSKLSPAFKTAIGPTTTLKVEGGKSGKTSAEVVAAVRATPGAIGYLDYAYAIDLALPTVQLKNQWGKSVAVSPEALQLAMRTMDWEKMLIDPDPSFAMDLTDAGCPGCWPIASATYVLVPMRGANAATPRVLEFFETALRDGDAAAAKEGYVPLPSRAKSLVSLSMRRWQTQLEKAGLSKPQRRTGADEPALLVASASR